VERAASAVKIVAPGSPFGYEHAMRVERITLKNIGPFTDAVIQIPPAPEKGGEVILFEGPNGSGKTTIAQALAAAAASRLVPPTDMERDRYFRNSQGPRGGERPPPGPKPGASEALSDNLVDIQRRRRSPDFRAESRFVHGGQSIDVVLYPGGVTWQAEPAVDFANRASAVLLEKLGSFADGGEAPIAWAAFAFGPHLPTLDLMSEGPRQIGERPLDGALSFGRRSPASRHLGQLLVNLEFDMIKAERYARSAASPEEREKLEATARSRDSAIHGITAALSAVLGRTVRIELPVGSVERQSPTLRLDDGPPVPMDLLGEGLRSTAAWLSDLMVRLLRIDWENPLVPPFEQEFWLILDEAEESLHPQMQVRLLPSLREIFPNARIYATTHSPFLVASLGEGHVFRLRPDPHTHLVSGVIEPLALTPGRSLEWVVGEVFDTPSHIVDEATRDKLDAHLRGVDAIRRNAPIDWAEFLSFREWLRGLNDEVRAIVAMREVPVRQQISARLEGAAV
jgi:energy-coupling factor transporter ATP-binding protein EcfA2